eukprot:5823738-Pyramimonas_sp.AAC.1
MFAEGISDHSPVQISFAPRELKPEEDQPVPAFTCRQPEFKYFLDLLMSHSYMHTLQAIPKWAEYKRLLREAARLTRNKLVSMRTPPLGAKL